MFTTFSPRFSRLTMLSAARLLRGLWLTAACLTISALVAPAASAPASAEVERLVGVLKSNAARKEKADACRELSRIGDQAAVAPLAALLGDEELSHMARYGLETIPGAAVDQAFRDALPRLQGRPLVGVIGSIGVRRDTKAVKALTGFLGNPDPQVAQGAARALGNIGDSAAAKALLAALPQAAADNQLAFQEGLLRCAENLAAKGNRKTATDIYDRLRISPGSHQVRTAAWRGSILTRGKSGVRLLQEALQAPEYALFATGLRVSYEMPGKEVTQTLVSLLPTTSGDKQLMLVQVLGKRGDASALAGLAKVARQAEKPVRMAALQALTELGAPGAVPVLLELVTASDADLSRTARESLAALPGREAEAAVLELLNNAESPKRMVGIELASRRRLVGAVPALFKAAESPDASIRNAALKSLGELGGAAEMPILLDLLLRAQTAEQVENCEQALSVVAVKAGDPEGTARRVGELLARATPPQKSALLRVLTAVGGNTALVQVRKTLQDSQPEIRATAIRCLGGWNTPDAAPDLLELARNPKDATEKMLSLRSYLNFAAQSDLPAEQRLSMCKAASALVQKPDEQKALLSALASVGTPDSLALVTPYLGDAAVKEEAATAALNITEKLLKGPDAAKSVSALIEPLQTVANSGLRPEIAQRAQRLLEQAKAKGNK